MSSNRSPSPLSSRNYRNSETNSTSRKSFNGNPFARPNSLINPKNINTFTPANTPTATDLNKRNSVTRKSICGGSMFQDGKENRKDSFRSPAKTAPNFMSPTISAASKFNPSPRRQILAEKNEESAHDPKPVEPKKLVLENLSVDEVNLASTNDDSDVVKIRPSCCSPITSPIVPVTESDPNPPPYDPKKNFLSPRPQYLRYKPNPRIELFLNKEGDNEDEESDVTRLEESFNLSDNSSSDTEEKDPGNGSEPEKEPEFGNNSVSSVTGEKEPEKEPLGEIPVCEAVLEENPIDLKVERVLKPRGVKGFLGSKTVWFVFVLFLVACLSLSFTESPPIDLPIYEDVGFLEIYQGSLRIAAVAKESFDGVVENIKKWSIDQKSYFFPTHNIGDLQFFNLTTPPLQEEFQFNRHIETDYIQEFQEVEEEDFEEIDIIEEDFEEIEEVLIEEPINVQIESDVEEAVERKSNLDEAFMSELEPIPSEVDEGVIEEAIIEKIQSEIVEAKSNLDESFVSKSEAIVEVESELVENDLEVESSQSIVTICVAGFFVVVMIVSTVFYMNKKKTNGSKSANIVANDDSMREESGSSERSSSNNMQKSYKKHKRESLASSSSNFSTSDSFGSFTTFERIAIKHKDEVMLTPIRRSSRLLKNQAVGS